MKTLKLLSLIVLTIGFSACGTTDDDSTSTTDINSSNTITITTGDTISCSGSTAFSVEPLDNYTPDIIFTRDTSTGVTTIKYNLTEGSALVLGCTEVD